MINKYPIPFNKPYMSGSEVDYIRDAVLSGKISGDGKYSGLVHQWFESNYGIKKTLLTTSCTDALEMVAILLNVMHGDEIIMPSFTFVSTANAFVLRGARIVFADSCADHPNINPHQLEELITEKTKAIVVVHYAGVACDMDAIAVIAEKAGIAIVEDAAQAIDSKYRGVPLGGIGQFGTLSFHETKNIVCGEGGLLMINRDADVHRAEIIREKGTNRSEFFRGQVDKYGWVDIGSSFLPSDITAAYLYAQLENKSNIQNKRMQLWKHYDCRLQNLSQQGLCILPTIPEFAQHNAHIYYLICRSLQERTELIALLRQHGIYAAFHYQSLHISDFYASKHDGRLLPYAECFSDKLVRLPMFYELSISQVDFICDVIDSRRWLKI